MSRKYKTVTREKENRRKKNVKKVCYTWVCMCCTCICVELTINSEPVMPLGKWSYINKDKSKYFWFTHFKFFWLFFQNLGFLRFCITIYSYLKLSFKEVLYISTKQKKTEKKKPYHRTRRCVRGSDLTSPR